MQLSIKVSYDASKLAKKLKDMVRSYVKVVTEHTVEDIHDGLESGRDINEKSFTKIEPVTKIVRKLRNHSPSNPPLVASGRMKRSIKASHGSRSSKIKASTYGNASKPNAHQEGFVTQNNPIIRKKLFRFKGKEIPAREFLHTEASISKNKKLSQLIEREKKAFMDTIDKILSK